MTPASRAVSAGPGPAGLTPDHDAAPAGSRGVSLLATLVRAGAITAIVDATFSSVLSVIYYGTPARVWQGVAATLLGPSALQGGGRTTAIGLAMHVGVAFGWSTVFLALYTAIPALRRLVASRWGVLEAASLYGPAIWLVMSFLVIPSLVHRPPTIGYRWWIQFFGHIPAVAVPMIWAVRRGRRAT